MARMEINGVEGVWDEETERFVFDFGLLEASVMTVGENSGTWFISLTGAGPLLQGQEVMVEIAVREVAEKLHQLVQPLLAMAHKPADWRYDESV